MFISVAFCIAHTHTCMHTGTHTLVRSNTSPFRFCKFFFPRSGVGHMAGALPSKKLVVAHGRPTANSANGGMNIQMGLTIGGAALLFLCLTIIGCVWVVNYLDTTNALTASSQAFRKTLAATLSADIASMMKPLWVLARQAVDEMEETRSIDGVKVMPPSLETMRDHADDLQTFLWAKVNAEEHMRQVESLQNFQHNIFFGCGAMLACAEQACAEGTFAHDAASCMDAVRVWSYISDETPPVYYTDHQYFVNGTGYHQQKVWDNLAKQIVHIESNIPVWTCSETMGAFGRIENMQPDYHNFSWHGPVASESATWRNFIAGTVPINDATQQIIGQVSCQVLSQGIGLTSSRTSW